MSPVTEGRVLLTDIKAVGGSDFSHALTKLTSSSTLSTSLSLTSVVYSTSKKLEFGSEFEPITPSERDEILEVSNSIFAFSPLSPISFPLSFLPPSLSLSQCLFPDCVPGSSLSGHGELAEVCQTTLSSF